MVLPVTDKLDRVRTLCRAHRVRRLWVFGSATTDEFDPSHSDLDFLVEFEPHQRRAFDDVYFLLRDDLEALFGRAVDLVELDAVTNPYFRQAVEAHRIELYAAA
jgi:uncharacterized protein